MHSSRLLVTAALSAAVTLFSAAPALAAPRSTAPTVGYDVSYPQCGGRLPKDPAFGIVGVSDGLAYGQNPCLSQQYAWALKAPKTPAFYMNTGNPGTATTRTSWYRQDGPQACSEANESGCAYNYGWFAAKSAFEYAGSQASLAAATNADWWLDVETANSWSTDTALNVVDIQGSIDFLASKVATVGVYSTGYQWGQITGGAQLGASIPNWVAGALNAKGAPALCSSGFSGGLVRYVQYVSGGFDANYACP
jgi:hypothetical protein